LCEWDFIETGKGAKVEPTATMKTLHTRKQRLMGKKDRRK
jgi:hypothetical protein